MKRGSRKHKLIDYYLGIFLVFSLGLVKRLFRFRKRRFDPAKTRRVLFIKLAAVGDSLIFLTIIKAFKDKYPAIPVDVLASPINEQMLRGVPFVEHVWIFPLSFEKGGLVTILSFLSELRKKRYDLAIDGEQWSRLTPLIAFYAKIKIIIGFRTTGQFRHFLYDEVVEHDPARHEWNCFQDMVKPLGVQKVEKPRLYFTPEVIRSAQKSVSMLPADSLLVVFHPGCGRHGFLRQWPLERYAQLAASLQSRFTNLTIVITGGEGEEKLTAELKGLLGEKAVNLGGQLPLMEMSYLISKADLFVSGNTGPMHIAAAANVPLIALHGPTNPNKWGPLTEQGVVIKSPLSCSPCLTLGFEYGCMDNECMKEVATEVVTAAAVKLLEQRL